MVNLKEQVGIKAAEFVKDGMIVGLGTGSTAYYFVAELGRRIKEEGLQITAVTTSSVTYDQAESLGIPLKAIDDVEVVDVTVDGADEVDPQLNGIKGGGGALLMEKIVATNSKDCILSSATCAVCKVGYAPTAWRMGDCMNRMVKEKVVAIPIGIVR